PLRFADAFPFHALIAPAGAEILVLLGAATWPVDNQPVGHVALPHAKRDRQLRLRKVTRPAFYHARSGFTTAIDPHGGADSIPVRLRSYQAHADASVAA